MKKLMTFLGAALLVLALGAQTPSHAFDRVTRLIKVCTYPVASASADAVLTMADGTGYCDVSNMAVDRITIDYNLTVTGGSGVVLKAITTSDPANIIGTVNDAALKGQDASATAFVSGTITSTPLGSIGLNISPDTGLNALGANLGTKVGVWADTTGSTYVGTVRIVVFGKQ